MVARLVEAQQEWFRLPPCTLCRCSVMVARPRLGALAGSIPAKRGRRAIGSLGSIPGIDFMKKIIVDGNELYVPAQGESLHKRLQEGTKIKLVRNGEDTMDGGRIPLVIEYDDAYWLQPILGHIVNENFKSRPAGSIEYEKDYFRFVRCKEVWTRGWEVV